MPKKNGVNKTYSFSAETLKKLMELCKNENRTQTNMLEVLVKNEYDKRKCNG